MTAVASLWQAVFCLCVLGGLVAGAQADLAARYNVQAFLSAAVAHEPAAQIHEMCA
ncbi:hypothetical protein ACGFNU_08900 [Spirillospora sp. NPDC048911]|uniref:hypothetical protein n=1 Tax=Spirillospora sp. NPDC048911 TaxID=3364527 RepID=UPI0037148054